MSKRDTCQHGRPECECAVAEHLRLQTAGRLSLGMRVAFEHDFTMLEQKARAIHAFFDAGMYDEAVEWLEELVNVSRGLRAALSPCEHEWKQREEDGQLYCSKGCSAVQLR